VIRLRFTFREIMGEAEIVAILDRIRKRGSHGVCLKARDTPAVREAVARLVQARIPVFTLVTDLPGTDRRGYFGLDNAQAGRTAAFLLAHALPRGAGAVLTSRSQDSFTGEADRHRAFREVLARLRPDLATIDMAGGAGVAATTTRELAGALSGAGPISAVYSMGGGNAAILGALARQGHGPVVFIAHDLDRENRRLLSEGAITFVLHHDLEADMRTLYAAVLTGDGAQDVPGVDGSSDVQIFTPYNLSMRRDAG
jgi:LacI family transcriptional regulator